MKHSKHTKELKYMEDVNSAASTLTGDVLNKLEEMFGLTITVDEEDEIWECFQSVLENYSETGDYKNYN